MGKEKAGFLTAKGVANRIKAKGLQKLRWYCQMCNKQCRDENGFKCHCMSESHQRQMEMFSENSNAFMDEFSKEFEEGMLEIISRKARSQRCSANVIYREYIGDKQHFHMNATIWETLTDFVMYLGRTGKCEVDETEKGWFVTYIDRDPEKLRRQEDMAKRERYELDSDEKHQRAIERQVKAARLSSGDDAPAATELLRTDPSEKVTCGFSASGKATGKSKLSAAGSCSLFAESEASAEESGGSRTGGASSSAGGSGKSGKKESAIDALMAADKKRKDTSARTDYWLTSGVIVKVMNKKLRDGLYYKQKGTIEKVVERYTAHVRMHASGSLVSLDQDDLETVIPSEGGKVRIVNGAYRGSAAKLLSIDVDRFCVSLRIEGGTHGGRVLDGIEYEDVCKLSTDTD